MTDQNWREAVASIEPGDRPVLLEALEKLTGQYQYWLTLRLTTQAERELATIKLAALDRIGKALVGEAEGQVHFGVQPCSRFLGTPLVPGYCRVCGCSPQAHTDARAERTAASAAQRD